MAEDRSPHGPAGTSVEEELPVAPRRNRLYLLGGVAAVAAVAALSILASHRDDGAASGSPSSAPVTAVPVTSAPLPSRSAPTAKVTAYPAAVLDRVVDQVCDAAARCRSPRGDARLAGAARRALGPLEDLRVFRLGDRRAVVVGALLRSGAQLLAVAVRPGVRISPTSLGIASPLGVQTQDNPHTRLTVVVSGRRDAVGLLGLPQVQRWLAGLSA